MLRILSLPFASFLIVLVMAVPARAIEFALGPTLTTLGFGLTIPAKLSDRWQVRLEANKFRAGFRSRIGTVRWEMGLHLGTVGTTLDFRPNRDGLVVSAGIYLNRNGATLLAAPTSDVQIGSRTFTPTEVGTLRGELSYRKFAPYLGLGYDNTFRNQSAWSFSFRAGFLYMGAARVSLSATGTLKDNLAFLGDLREEERAVAGVLDVVRFYPVLSIGVRYRF